MLQLNDKVAIVTGAGRGNGRGVAMALADHGAAVMVCDINEENAKNVAKEINESGGKAIAAYCDVTDPASVDAMVQKTLDELGPITTLINNAGVIYWKADKIGATIPLGRCGDCYKDHGHICCFLASDEYSGWITAENILVDGGKNMIPYIYDPKNAPVFNT